MPFSTLLDQRAAQSPTSPAVVLLFAAWRPGATVTRVNPALTDVEAVRQLHDSAANLLVVETGASGVGDVPVLQVDDLAH